MSTVFGPSLDIIALGHTALGCSFTYERAVPRIPVTTWILEKVGRIPSYMLHVCHFMFDQHGTPVSHAKPQKWQWHATFSVQWPCARWLTETSLMVCPTSCVQQLVQKFKHEAMTQRVEENCHCLQDVDQFGPHGCQVHLKLKMWRLMMGCRHQACRIGATGTVSAMKKGGGFQNSKCCWRLETYLNGKKQLVSE